MNGFEVASAVGPSRGEIERERGWTLGERLAEAGRMRCGCQLIQCYCSHYTNHAVGARVSYIIMLYFLLYSYNFFSVSLGNL